MTTARAVGVQLAGLTAVAGVATSVVLARGSGNLTNAVAIAVVVTAYALVSVVIAVARPGNLVGRLALFGAVAWGVGEGALALGVHGYLTAPGSLPGAPWFAVLGTVVRGVGWLVLVVAVPLVFPDGRPSWPDHRLPVVVTGATIVLFALGSLLSPAPLETRLEEMASPTGLPERLAAVADLMALTALGLAMVALAIAVAGLVRRWRAGGEFERQQLLWFSAAFALPIVFLPLIATDLVEPWMFALMTLPVPVSIGVAVLQRRLYDVHLVVSRTLTYVALSVTVAALYALTVGGVGALLRERGAPWLAWVAAGVVAVSFAPLRNALQQGVNRMTYGQWAQPADVLAATGRRLADASDVPGLLDTLTAELGSTLGLGFVEIADAHGRALARHGTPGDTVEEVKLTAYGVPVGALRWSAHRLRSTERDLLEALAHQLGAVVHASILLDTIRDGQERLVLAREEERRRLRRDLHDGLGPALATLTMQVDTLRNRLGSQHDGQRLDLDAELVRLRDGIRGAVVDVRRIVEGLRPPALDELGVLGAVEQLVAHVTQGTDLTATLTADPLPRLPAAVEVAIYRVAQEALTNLARHSGAGRAQVEIRLSRNEVLLTVQDDGTGTTSARDGGVGLTTMRERAEEIGGTLTVDSSPGRGTTIRLRLPLQPSTDRAQQPAVSTA